ncbi:MAG: MFS transporter [Candidatus Edwardsbacteria bacterium]
MRNDTNQPTQKNPRAVVSPVRNARSPLRKNTQISNGVKRNFALGVTNGIFFNGASAFVDPQTVLPFFLSQLTSSKFLIGLGSSIETAGWCLPQFFVAHFLEKGKHKLPYYIFAAYIRTIALILFTLFLFLFPHNSLFLLSSFFFLFSLYSLGGGLAGVAFMDIFAKTIPPEKRGSFWGMRMFFGGILAAAAGLVVKHILTKSAFPLNFAWIFLFATLLITAGLVAFSHVTEPPEDFFPVRLRYFSYLKNTFLILLNDKFFRYLLFFRYTLGCWAMAGPFYIIYAKEVLNIQKGTVGIFLTLQMATYVLSNFLWTHWGNQKRNQFILKVVAILSFFPPLIALVSLNLLFSIYFFSLIFLLQGAIISGISLGHNNLIIEIAPHSKRPTYIGFMNTLLGPAMLLPALGGIIVELFSLKILFSFTLLFSFCTFLQAKAISE